jgi:hypothetical protein
MSPISGPREQHAFPGQENPQSAHYSKQLVTRLDYFTKDVKADARRAEELRRHRKEAERLMLYNRLDHQSSK